MAPRDVVAFNEAGEKVDPDSPDAAYGEYTDEQGIRNYFVKAHRPVVITDEDPADETPAAE